MALAGRAMSDPGTLCAEPYAQAVSVMAHVSIAPRRRLRERQVTTTSQLGEGGQPERPERRIHASHFAYGKRLLCKRLLNSSARDGGALVSSRHHVRPRLWSPVARRRQGSTVARARRSTDLMNGPFSSTYRRRSSANVTARSRLSVAYSWATSGCARR